MDANTSIVAAILFSCHPYIGRHYRAYVGMARKQNPPYTIREALPCLPNSIVVYRYQSCSHSITALTTDHSLTLYVDNLKRVYQTPPTNWLSLPNCKHIKLAMTNEKGTRHTREPDELIEHRIKGEVDSLMASKVPVDMDNIFDDGIFENIDDTIPKVILIEGAFGSGKTRLAYHYCQKWAQGNLGMFELVALVYLRHPVVHSAGKGLTLHQLLLLASDGKEVTDDIARHVAQLVKNGPKCLLILDGWDEGPTCLRAPPDLERPPDNSFLGDLLRSVSPNTTILITSRPDSSVDLHNRSNMQRLEILGFTKERIHEYFREALSTQLSSMKLEDECRKLSVHLANYPAIESSCYIPLNAAILTLLYLQRNRTLPTTYFKMFYELILYFIAREVNTRQPKRNLRTISSLDALPPDLKKQLEHISILAYKGVRNNKLVFTEDELPSILPSEGSMFTRFLCCILPPAQQDLPAMGVLQRVQWAGTSGESISYNFVHLSIQEMLAAYRISQMGNDQQVRVFQTLLSKPRFAAVLQFYAGFTKLTNRGVRNIITSSDFTNDKSSMFSLLSSITCLFEAQICDQLLYTKIISRLNGEMSLNGVTLSPLDCLSVGYFLSLVLENVNSIELSVNLSDCSIDDHSIGLMMGELSKHAEACPAGALNGVTELIIINNKIGDNGIAHIATALQTNTTMRRLNMENCSISFVGADSLTRALVVNKSLQDLNISGNDIGDLGITCITTVLKTNNTLKTCIIGGKTTTDDGALLLAAALTANRSMEYLKLYWSSTHPDSTLKEIGECVRMSTLKQLILEINMPSATASVPRANKWPLPPAAKERAKEWLQCVEVGGKELIQSLEDSQLFQKLFLKHDFTTQWYFESDSLQEQVRQSYDTLIAAAEALNDARRSAWKRVLTRRKELPPIKIDIYLTSKQTFHK